LSHSENISASTAKTPLRLGVNLPQPPGQTRFVRRPQLVEDDPSFLFSKAAGNAGGAFLILSSDFATAVKISRTLDKSLNS